MVYEALKGKDDQVMALLMGMYFVYIALDNKTSFQEWVRSITKNALSIDELNQNFLYEKQEAVRYQKNLSIFRF